MEKELSYLQLSRARILWERHSNTKERERLTKGENSRVQRAVRRLPLKSAKGGPAFLRKKKKSSPRKRIKIGQEASTEKKERRP